MFSQEIKTNKKLKSNPNYIRNKKEAKSTLQQESELLKQLQEVDPEAVRECINKQKTKELMREFP